MQAYWVSVFLWDFVIFLLVAACALGLLKAFNVNELVNPATIGKHSIVMGDVFLLSDACNVLLRYSDLFLPSDLSGLPWGHL